LIKEIDGMSSVVGPAGVDKTVLRKVITGGGGFGVSDEVPLYLESRVCEYLAQRSNRIAVFELLMGPESVDIRKLSFPCFIFSPSLYGTSDGRGWTDWKQGTCGYQTSLDFDVETVRRVLVESDWAKGIIFFMPLKESNRKLLEEGVLWDEGLLEGLFENIDVILVPAHNREALVVWQRSESGAAGMMTL
jgi:hypothetical protein